MRGCRAPHSAANDHLDLVGSGHACRACTLRAEGHGAVHSRVVEACPWPLPQASTGPGPPCLKVLHAVAGAPGQLPSEQLHRSKSGGPGEGGNWARSMRALRWRCTLLASSRQLLAHLPRATRAQRSTRLMRRWDAAPPSLPGPAYRGAGTAQLVPKSRALAMHRPYNTPARGSQAASMESPRSIACCVLAACLLQRTSQMGLLAMLLCAVEWTSWCRILLQGGARGGVGLASRFAPAPR